MPAVYEVQHVTKYRYAGNASSCQNQLRLTPRNEHGQQLLQHSIQVTPKCKSLLESVDAFGNKVSYFEIYQPHESLVIDMHAKVRVDRQSIDLLNGSPNWESISQNAFRDKSAVGLDTLQYAFASPHAPICEAATEFARPIFEKDRPLFECLRDLNQQLHHYIKYEPNVTTIQTTVQEVFQLQRGVCQDIAHAALSCLRAFRIPARYISGYLRTYSSVEQTNLIGADASHAWISVYAGPVGWIDLDPTNNLVVSNEHIVVAWGRDFRDVTPINGLFVGADQQAMEVSVRVTPLERGNTPPSALSSN